MRGGGGHPGQKKPRKSMSTGMAMRSIRHSLGSGKVGDLNSHLLGPWAKRFDCWGLILDLWGWKVHKVLWIFYPQPAKPMNYCSRSQALLHSYPRFSCFFLGCFLTHTLHKYLPSFWPSVCHWGKAWGAGECRDSALEGLLSVGW